MIRCCGWQRTQGHAQTEIKKAPHIFICLIYPASFVHSALFRTVLPGSKQSLCLVAQTWCNSMGEPARTKLHFLNLSISSLLPFASPNLLACETPSMILVSSFCSHCLGSAVVLTCNLLSVSFRFNTFLLYPLSGPQAPAWYCDILLSIFEWDRMGQPSLAWFLTGS